jgi:cell cycle sensor histidine kinase DivJ
VNLVLPVREYINSLVHSSAHGDMLMVARHRSFIAIRVLGGALALAMLPVYLVARSAITPLEAAVFGWFLLPIAVAYYLSRTGRYESAHVLSSLALTVLVTMIAAISGGLSSPAAVWLVLLPLEAALCASRRAVLIATGFAFAAAALLYLMGSAVLGAIPEATGPSPWLAGVSLGAAVVYAALQALSAEALARAGSRMLSEDEERYRLLTSHMTDVISRHGRSGVVQFVSPAAEKLFGVEARELLGYGLFDRIHVADRPAYMAALAEAAAGMDESSVEFRARRMMGGGDAREGQQFFWLEMRCRRLGSTPLAVRSGVRSDVVAVMRDVTERKEQEQLVAAARREAEAANAAKSRFLATMSHELRTPLNAVIGFSEMLMNEQAMAIDAERRHDYARLIHDSGHHLLSVVNLVLDMSKIETGNFVITAEPFAPGPVIRSCCDLLALKAREAGLDVVALIPDDLPEMVADKRALKQMLLNLLSNAIKFTERGGQVSVNVWADDARLVLEIEDTGVGISEDDLPRIGDPFFQAQGSYARPYEGTGLGLSIVKGLVELHGGTLVVTSRVGVGTCVTIRLPLDCERTHAKRTVVELSDSLRREPARLEPQSEPAQPELAHWLQREVKKSA